MKLNYGPTVIIAGLDGTGKSYAAQEAARNISGVYPERTIAVTDSTGFYEFRAGDLTDHRYSRIVDLKPDVNSSKLGSMASLGAFTLSRKVMDYRGMLGSDLLLSVRDSHRIDPATYARVYAGPIGKLSTTRRLAIFDRLSHSPPAETIIHVRVDAQVAIARVQNRDNATVDRHETPANMGLLAEELPAAVEGYARLFGAHVFDVEGLTNSTVDEITGFLEPIAAQAD